MLVSQAIHSQLEIHTEVVFVQEIIIGPSNGSFIFFHEDTKRKKVWNLDDDFKKQTKVGKLKDSKNPGQNQTKRRLNS